MVNVYLQFLIITIIVLLKEHECFYAAHQLLDISNVKLISRNKKFISRQPKALVPQLNASNSPNGLNELSNYLGKTNCDSSIISFLNNFADAGILVKKLLSNLSINSKLSLDGLLPSKSIDIVANDIILLKLSNNNIIDGIISEENDEIIWKSMDRAATYDIDGYEVIHIVAFDPIDGSSNIDCAIPTGTIFALYRVLLNKNETFDLKILNGNNIIASGYIMYSASTEMVFSTGENAVGFTLDSESQKWILTRENIKCPTRGPYYSLNEGRSSDWPTGLRRYINDIKDGKSQWGKRYSSRYVCSLVADFHRTLLYGGWAGNPRSHLRLLYEAAPLSFIAEKADGKGSDGIKRILDIYPTTIHHRLPLFIGSSLDITELESYEDVQQITNIKYEV
eukprot:gene12488-16754_t